MAAFTGQGDAALLAQDLPDGAGRTGQTQPRGRQVGILPEIVQNGFRAGRALQVAGWGIADLEDALHDAGTEAGRRVRARAGAGVEHLLVGGVSRAEAGPPFLDPADGAVGGIGEVLQRPAWLGPEQGAQAHAIRKVVGFGVHLATSLGEEPEDRTRQR